MKEPKKEGRTKSGSSRKLASGDYYGEGERAKIGKVRMSYYPDATPKGKLKKPPTKVA